jgi:hypothetical protein
MRASRIFAVFSLELQDISYNTILEKKAIQLERKVCYTANRVVLLSKKKQTVLWN